jgi:uncharacterized protein (DUF1800 family)
MHQCVDLLLTPSALPAPPDYVEGGGRSANEKSFVFGPPGNGVEKRKLLNLKGWWIRQMLQPQKNITEKMVLFWHNHFVIEFTTVNDVRYCYRYLNTLRQNATGNFKTLLRQITTDPAMLVYLNGNLNNNTAANENYGRELQELFTVGKGPDSHYTEGDVKSAARVLCGWKDDKDKIDSYFAPVFHSHDEKVFSSFYNNCRIAGKQGAGGAKETDELIEMICSNREVSRFLCRKLYRWFVHSNIDEQVEAQVITPLAEMMVHENYEVTPVLKALFSAEFFYQPKLMGGMFKTPIDFLLDIVRGFDPHFSDMVHMDTEKLWNALRILSKMSALLGQNIGDPPNVAGWPAYYEYPSFDKFWINSEFLSVRNKIVRILAYPSQSEQPVQLDFVDFVNHLPRPGDALALLTDSLKLLCCIQPGSSQVNYMKQLLDAEKAGGQKWADLWAQYKSNPTLTEVRDEVTARLQRIYVMIFMFPEFQIM